MSFTMRTLIEDMRSRRARSQSFRLFRNLKTCARDERVPSHFRLFRNLKTCARDERVPSYFRLFRSLSSTPVIDLSIRRCLNLFEHLFETVPIIQYASKYDGGDPPGIANVLQRVCFQEHKVCQLAPLDGPDRICYPQKPG